jgi:hypothetical protein
MLIVCIEGNHVRLANTIGAYHGQLLSLIAIYTCNIKFTPCANRGSYWLLPANYWALVFMPQPPTVTKAAMAAVMNDIKFRLQCNTGAFMTHAINYMSRGLATAAPCSQSSKWECAEKMQCIVSCHLFITLGHVLLFAQALVSPSLHMPGLVTNAQAMLNTAVAIPSTQVSQVSQVSSSGSRALRLPLYGHGPAPPMFLAHLFMLFDLK